MTNGRAGRERVRWEQMVSCDCVSRVQNEKGSMERQRKRSIPSQKPGSTGRRMASLDLAWATP